MDRFEVVAMATGPRRHVEVFRDYYRRLGADRVRVFYDGPADVVRGCDPAAVIRCDGAFWREVARHRPAIVEDRQRAVYRHAYASARSDWVLFVDIDEFVFGKARAADVFSRVGRQVDSIRFESAEAVYAPAATGRVEYGAAYFRRPCSRAMSVVLPHILYPGVGHLFIRGLLGHSRGKHAIRAGLEGVHVGLHDSLRDGVPMSEVNASTLPDGERMLLAHYDAISFDQWCEKWRRRLERDDTREMGRKREWQMALFRKHHRRGREEQLFRRLYFLSDRQVWLLRLLGLVVEDSTDVRARLDCSNDPAEHGEALGRPVQAVGGRRV
jgi:hypothetical protein